MKKFRIIILLLPLLLLSVAIVPQAAQARTMKYVVPTTPTSGLSHEKWQGGIYGAYTSVEVSDPGVTDCGVGCGSWGRNLTISTQDGSQSASVGFEKNATGLSGTFCSGKAGLYAFLAYNSYTVCYSLQSGDVNNACSLEIEDRGSTKISYVISCAVSQPCPFNSPCQLNKTVPAWFYINENEGYNQPFSGNELVWGVAWADNQWRGANLGDWHYQTVDGTQFAGNPPQLYWFIRPSQDPSRIGGQLYSCIYATGYNNNKCKFEA